MKGKKLEVIVVVISMIMLCAPMQLYGFDKELGLDHFKFYSAGTHYREFKVGLKGQFDKKQILHYIAGPAYFGNPVSKNRGGILDKNAHLSLYRMHAMDTIEEPTRLVYGKNQFGEFKLYIGAPVALLTPAMKIEKGLAFPQKLNHFKCYYVLKFSEFKPQRVSLQDQFDKKPISVSLARPVLFCVPVIKYRDGKPEKQTIGKGHLLIYSFRPIRYDYPKLIQSTDQFGKWELSNFTCRLLAVPTWKLKWKVVDKVE